MNVKKVFDNDSEGGDGPIAGITKASFTNPLGHTKYVNASLHTVPPCNGSLLPPIYPETMM